jgi:hypothetical protein
MKHRADYNLTDFANDHAWVERNRSDLVRRFPDRWIAVRNGQVIASAPDVDALQSQIPDAPHACVEFLASHPVEMIL